MYFLVNKSLINCLTQQFQTLQVNMSHDVEDTGQYFV